MIVKILDKKNHHESIYDCETVVMNSIDKPYVSIDIIQALRCQTIDINKETEVIFIMNNDGKTIETYRW